MGRPAHRRSGIYGENHDHQFSHLETSNSPAWWTALARLRLHRHSIYAKPQDERSDFWRLAATLLRMRRKKHDSHPQIEPGSGQSIRRSAGATARGVPRETRSALALSTERARMSAARRLPDPG